MNRVGTVCGYPAAGLRRNGVRPLVRVEVACASSFIGEAPEVRHKKSLSENVRT